MPKKTKQEKILAESRRKQPEAASPQFQFHATPAAGHKAHATALTNDLVPIKKDLVYTITLALIAIIGELLLSRIL